MIEIVNKTQDATLDDFVYVVFSATPYKMGRFVRRFTGGRYNHVSVSANRELTELYSFARRYRCAPFIGGFVKESSGRFSADGKTTDIMVCAVPVSASRKEALMKRLAEMKHEREKYIYNFFSAAAVPFRRKIRVKDAYTCVEFTVHMLSLVGYSFRGKSYIGIDDLKGQLEKYKIYEGEFPEDMPTDIFDDYEYAVSYTEHYLSFLKEMNTLAYRKMRYGNAKEHNK